jgi:hypothetical protein
MKDIQNCVCGKDPGSPSPQVAIANYSVSAADEIRAIDDWATAWNLEQKGLVSAIKKAGVPVVKIGRQWAARRSDLIAIVDRIASKPSPPPLDPTYASLVATARGAGPR